ncbi:MAG: lytic transglycosylase domain-containing protein [Chromatiaceae bacterium]|nr:lytic transglycosylase domain-containing protein [Candidatus Thioaporhodococcus sediminis]
MKPMRDEEQWSIQTLAEAHGVPPALAMALVGHESNFDPTAVSPKGARGLGQLMPGTAKSLGVDPADPRQNVDGSLRYLKQQYDAFGSWDKALAAYNGGPGRLSAAKGDIGRMPPETRAYVPAVLQRAEKYAAQPAAPPPPAARKYYDYSDLFPRQGGAAAEEPDYSDLFPESRPPLMLSPEPQAPSSLDQIAQGKGPWDAAMISAGNAVASAGRGAGQLAAWLTGDASPERLAQLAAEDAEAKAAMAPLRAASPIATGVGEVLPYLAIPGGQATALRRIGTPALLGAGWEALKYGTPEERGQGAAQGAIQGGVGGLVGEALSRILRPIRSITAPPAGQEAARAMGAPLSAGQQAGNRTVQSFEDYLRQSPFGGLPFERLANQQQTAVNRTAASALGEAGDAVTKEMLGNTARRVGAEFDRLQAVTDILPDAQLATEIGNIWANATPHVAELVLGKIDDFQRSIDPITGRLSGTMFRKLDTRLGEAIRSTSSSEVKTAYEGLQRAFRTASDRNISPDNQAAWRLARQQWRALKTLEKGRAVNEVTGDVSAPAVASALEQGGGRAAAKEGRYAGPLQDIAAFGRSMPNTAVGSKTAPRYFWNQLREHPAQALLGGGIPDYLLARAMANRGDYLVQGLLPGAIQPVAEGIAPAVGMATGLGLLDYLERQ